MTPKLKKTCSKRAPIKEEEEESNMVSAQCAENSQPKRSGRVPNLPTRRTGTASTTRVDISNRVKAPFPIYNELHCERFTLIRARDFLEARELGDIHLRRLGLMDDIERHLNTWGLLHLSSVSHDAYKPLVYEFLTTLHKLEDEDWEVLKFTVKGVERTFNASVFVAYFQMRNEGLKELPRDFDANAIWRELTGEAEFKRGKTKTNMIKDLAILICYKWFSVSVCGRTESNTVNKEDLWLLHCLMHPEAPQMNMVYRIFSMLRGMAYPRDSNRVIGMGFIISHIVEQFEDIPDPELEAMEKSESKLMDKYYLQHSHLIDSKFKPFPWHLRDAVKKIYGGRNPEEEAEQDVEDEQGVIPPEQADFGAVLRDDAGAGFSRFEHVPGGSLWAEMNRQFRETNDRIDEIQRVANRTWRHQEHNGRLLRQYLNLTGTGHYPSPPGTPEGQ